ncbi:MAG TPA: isoprenylcysteine carboxylmethyltransferase family protein, partial [Rhodospirillales bacterium]|nr:isoprenylcysteine carboxylmethyltransferase family protein [Rhodospirillales bacterium]
DSSWFSLQLASLEYTLLGGAIAVTGLALTIYSALGHRKIGSNVEPWKPTTAIISSGVYGYTRNPIYLGMAAFQTGLAIAGDSLGALVTLALSVMIIQSYVIAREERYLEAKFGSEYTDYKARVRRWI